MSRAYHHYSRQKTRSDRHALFPIVILLTCLVWAHKTTLTRVERLIPAILVIVVGAIGLVAAAKIVLKIRKHRRLHNPTLAVIDNMTGLEFEKYVARLLVTQGYKNVRLTETYDMGIDIVAEKDGIRWGVQTKRYSGLVKAEAVRQAVTALNHYGCDRAMVITNSVFSGTATKLASSNRCVLVGRNQLIGWIS